MTLNATTGMVATLNATENKGSLDSEKSKYIYTYIGLCLCMSLIHTLLSYNSKFAL